MNGLTRHCRLLLLLAVSGWTLITHAGEIKTLDVVEVDASVNASGTTDSANQGIVSRERLEARPVYRPAELLETTPGLIVTQHSGEGKANQYFLRGFNLDHGTDLAISVDGMPVNQRSHAHGQGWADLNFFISDLADKLEYKKGPYYAEQGDFSAAGAANIKYVTSLEKNIGEIGTGGFGYRRTFLAGSPKLGDGNILYGLEWLHNDAPFTNPEDFRKSNALLRYNHGDAQNGFNVTGMAYHAKWHSTDQIPLRAVSDGSLGRFDTVDSSDGGESSRYSLSGEWRRMNGNTLSTANAYVIKSKLSLFSNFTYFLDDPVNGDQFAQPDERVTSGFTVRQTWLDKWNDHETENTLGMDFRNDNIHNALYSTRERQIVSVTREDRIVESSVGIYVQNSLRWLEKFRTVAGLRSDFFRGTVDSSNADNNGKARDHITSPKLSLIFGPWAKTEYYINWGKGFHSNDVRGATITVDPKSLAAADKVPLLVRSQGIETGLRSTLVPNLQSSLSLYQLDFDSELLFVGDAGTTQASRPSRRVGFEFSNLYAPTSWLTIDADIAFARARFSNYDPAGDRIPGAVEGVASISAAIDRGPYFGSLQWRYFGPRPLIEDNSIRSSSTRIMNGRIGYKVSKTLKLSLDGFNLLNSKDSQIDYSYTSKLQGEAAGVSDIHFHPVESRSFRLTVTANF